MSKLLILVDYENFHICPIDQYNVEVSDKGVEKLIAKCTEQVALENKKNLVVAAFWDNFKKQKQFFASKFADIIDVYEKGSNVTDGYLIVSAVNKIKDMSAGDRVVIVAGDGVYTGLIRYCLSLGIEVHVYTWKASVSDAIRLYGDVVIHNLEDVYGFAGDEHLNNGWFIPTGLTHAEYAIISRALRPEFPVMFKVATANVIYKNTTDERYKHIDTYEAAIAFLEACENNSIFIAQRMPNPEKENKMQIAYILNRDNPKVKAVIGNEEKND